MREQIKIGTTGEERFVVTDEHVINFADSKMPKVLASPSLTWFLEQAARKAILPILEDRESCVGVMINVDHLAPTPPGKHVVCRARVIYTDGAQITFQLEAHDEQELVARGTHRRAVVDKDRLSRRVNRKI